MHYAIDDKIDPVCFAQERNVHFPNLHSQFSDRCLEEPTSLSLPRDTLMLAEYSPTDSQVHSLRRLDPELKSSVDLPVEDKEAQDRSPSILSSGACPRGRGRSLLTPATQYRSTRCVELHHVRTVHDTFLVTLFVRL